MKNTFAFLLIALCTSLPVALLADPAERTSTVADQRSINLTVYNDGNALVHDRRRIHVNAGVNRIAWRDVSATMDASSAVLGTLDPRRDVSVLEQNFDYNVLGQDSLLHAYVGKYVTVVHPPKYRGDRPHRERAKLLTADGGIVLQYQGRVETQLDGYIEFPGIPPALRDRPTLTLDLLSPVSAMEDLDLRYLASGISWHVDYIATLSRDQHSMGLMGLVTLDNESGSEYRNARLQLIAGAVHQAPPPRPVMRSIAYVVSATVDTYAVSAQEEAAYGYHLYTLGHATTILDKQTKQIGLLSAHDIPVTSTLEVNGSGSFESAYPSSTNAYRMPVRQYVNFKNKGGDLGIPLPAGAVRVYQDDSRGLSQFIGGDRIGHTPSGEDVRLYLGDSFDVVARKKQTDFHLISKCQSSSSYEIEIGNAGDTAKDVTVVEQMPGDWYITAQSQNGQKSSSHTQTWIVSVPADGQALLTYRADVRWCVP